MTQSASPDAETNLPSSPSDAEADAVPQSSPAASMSPMMVTASFTSQIPLHVQEYVRAYVHEHIKTLEQQLLTDQQRQRDRVEDELHKMRQHLMTTAQESRQHHQTMSDAFRETIEEIRKELSEVMYRLSQDVDRALRQSEIQNRQAVEKLRDEMLQALATRDLITTPFRRSVPPSATAEDHHA